MAKAPAIYLLERLRAVRANLGSPEKRWNDQDVEDVCLEAVAYIRDALDVPALEKELVSRSQIDRATLAEVTEWFRDIEKETPRRYEMTFPDGTNFDWPRRIERLTTLLDGLGNTEGLEELEIGLRLTFVGDAAFASMLMALPAALSSSCCAGSI